MSREINLCQYGNLNLTRMHSHQNYNHKAATTARHNVAVCVFSAQTTVRSLHIYMWPILSFRKTKQIQFFTLSWRILVQICYFSGFSCHILNVCSEALDWRTFSIIIITESDSIHCWSNSEEAAYWLYKKVCSKCC